MRRIKENSSPVAKVMVSKSPSKGASAPEIATDLDVREAMNSGQRWSLAPESASDLDNIWAAMNSGPRLKLVTAGDRQTSKSYGPREAPNGLFSEEEKERLIRDIVQSLEAAPSETLTQVWRVLQSPPSTSGIDCLKVAPPQVRWYARRGTADQVLSPPEFIARHYGEFLDGTVTRKSIRDIDASLDQALQNWLRKNDMPVELNLPRERKPRAKLPAALTAAPAAPQAGDNRQEQILEAAAEFAARTERPRASILVDFRAHAAVNQWKTRRDRGLPWNQDVFEFVRDTYAAWLQRAQSGEISFTRADLKKVDEALWIKFSQHASKRGVPAWLDLPTEKGAREILPETGNAMDVVRALQRRASQLRRRDIG